MSVKITKRVVKYVVLPNPWVQGSQIISVLKHLALLFFFLGFILSLVYICLLLVYFSQYLLRFWLYLFQLTFIFLAVCLFAETRSHSVALDVLEIIMWSMLAQNTQRSSPALRLKVGVTFNWLFTLILMMHFGILKTCPWYVFPRVEICYLFLKRLKYPSIGSYRLVVSRSTVPLTSSDARESLQSVSSPSIHCNYSSQIQIHLYFFIQITYIIVRSQIEVPYLVVNLNK